MTMKRQLGTTDHRFWFSGYVWLILISPRIKKSPKCFDLSHPYHLHRLKQDSLDLEIQNFISYVT